MNKIIKNVLLLSSGVGVGFIVGSVYVTKKFLDDREVASLLAKKTAEKVVDYIYGKAEDPVKRSDYTRYKKTFNPDEVLEPVIFDTKQEAEEVLEGMKNILETYGYVTVADYFELAGIPVNYKFHLYGWTDLDDARLFTSISHAIGAYSIVLPAHKRLENEDVGRK